MKKKPILIFLIFIITFSPSLQAQSNQLKNPGFASRLNEWIIKGTALAVSGSNVRTGNYAARVGSSSGILYQTLEQKLIKGRKYRLNFYSKISQSATSAKVSIRVRNASGNIVNLLSIPIISTSYSKHVKEFYYGPTANSVAIVIVKSGNQGYVYTDDFSIFDIWVQDFMSLVNNHRKSLNLKPLIHNDELGILATEHSANMAAGTLSFGHTDMSARCSEGRSILEGGNWCGENVAKSQMTPKAVFTSWMSSPGHRANIESAKPTHTGFGFKKNSSGVYYWTQIFIENSN